MTLTPERRAEIEAWIRDPWHRSIYRESARELLAALAEAERERDAYIEGYKTLANQVDKAERERDYWRERAIDRWEAAQRREIAEREAEGEYRCAKCGMPEVCDDADCPGREAEGE